MVQLAEKDRALRMASKPLPPSQDIILNFAVGKGRRVRLTNVEGYSATYYHLAPEVAHRETPNRQEDAYKAADQIEDLMKQKEKVTMHCIVCWEGYDLLAIRQQLENRKREMRRQGCVINRHTERFDSSRITVI
jgi:hypothetical protein